MSKLYMALQVLKFVAQFVPQPKRPTPDWSRLQDASARLHRTPSLANIAEPAVTSASPVAVSARIAMPTTAETVDELKRRLGKELYRMELDLLGGGRIAGKSCDCLSRKHHLGLEATAEELIPMDGNLAYGQIMSWLDSHKEEFEPEEIEKRPPEHYQAMAKEVRRFRKDIMGTENPGAMLTEGERSRVLAQINPAALPKAVPAIPAARAVPEEVTYTLMFTRPDITGIPTPEGILHLDSIEAVNRAIQEWLPKHDMINVTGLEVTKAVGETSTEKARIENVNPATPGK